MMPPAFSLEAPPAQISRTSRIKHTHSIGVKNANAFALASALSSSPMELSVAGASVVFKPVDLRTFPLAESRAFSIKPEDEELKDASIQCGFSDVPAGLAEASAVMSLELVVMGSATRAEQLSAALFSHVTAALTAIPGAILVDSRAASPNAEPTGERKHA